MPTSPAAARRGTPRAPGDQYVDSQLRRTSGQVKGVDLTVGALVVLAGTLLFLLLATLLDQWIVVGGLGTFGRWAAALLFGVCLLWAVVRWLAPSLWRAINPAFAAQTIEQSAPDLKNVLLNLLALRREREQLPQAVYRAVEAEAAQRLRTTRVELAVDRTNVLRAGYALLGVVVVCCLYAVLSPKDVWVSAARVLVPWSALPPPTRVRIEEVRPGNVQLQRGERLAITCEADGLAEDEPLELVFRFLSSQQQERVVNLQADVDRNVFRAWLPKDETGLFEDLEYWVRGGDAKSPSYRATVVATPTIRVTKLEYEYPAYTKFAPREVSDTGDIRALEGTRVRLRAEANYPIAAAQLDVGLDGTPDHRLRHRDQVATLDWVLQLADDSSAGNSQQYVLRYTTEDGLQSREPVESTLHIERDWPPEVTLLEPAAEETEVAVDAAVPLEIRALDPDFALARVTLRGEVEGKRPLEVELLRAQHEGQWVQQRSFRPAAHDLQPGDLLELWAVAEDNKRPVAGVTESARRRLRIVAGTGRQPDRQDPAAEESTPTSDSAPDAEQGATEDGQQSEQSGSEGGSVESEASESADSTEQGSPSKGSESAKATENGSEGAAGPEQTGSGGDSSTAAEEGTEGQPDGSGAAAGADQPGGESGGAESSGREGEPGPGSAEGATTADTPPGESGEEAASDRTDLPADVGEEAEKSDRPLETDGSDDAAALQELLKDPRLAERLKQLAEQERGGTSSGEQPADQPPQQGDSETDTGDETAQGQSEGQTPEESATQDNPSEPAAGQDPSPPHTDQGEAGSGTSDGSADPGPPPEQAQRPDLNANDEPTDQPPEDTPPPSPARDQRQSDAVGETGGDRTGEGETGGGKRANRDGVGSPGQNTAADEGEGASSETGGEGPTTDQTGGTTPGDTSSPGSRDAERSPGDSTAPTPSDPSPSDSDSDAASSDSSSKSSEDPAQSAPRDGVGQQGVGQGSSPSSSSSPENSTEGQGQTKAPAGGSAAGGEGPGAPPSEALPADQVDEEFARQATDLVLEHLHDQLANDTLDRNLLDRWGWSENDLRALLERWQGLLDADQSGDPVAEQDLARALRSLGIARDSFHRTDQRSKDGVQQLRSGHRIPPPQEYAEQFRAFQRGEGE